MFINIFLPVNCFGCEHMPGSPGVVEGSYLKGSWRCHCTDLCVHGDPEGSKHLSGNGWRLTLCRPDQGQNVWWTDGPQEMWPSPCHQISSWKLLSVQSLGPRSLLQYWAPVPCHTLQHVLVFRERKSSADSPAPDVWMAWPRSLTFTHGFSTCIFRACHTTAWATGYTRAPTLQICLAFSYRTRLREQRCRPIPANCLISSFIFKVNIGLSPGQVAVSIQW